MKSALIWFAFLGVVLLFGDSVDAWNRQVFNRYSRNLFRDAVGDEVASVAGGNNEMNELNALFGYGNGGGGGREVGIGTNQQPEVYGIVEPLIEDMPCVDRPCNVNDDCCPTGVCVNTYGEGKCVYVYGRKRDLCHRNADCELGMLCLRGAAGNLVCKPTPLSVGATDARSWELKQFGEECLSSSDCNVAKGMCCQLQRNHRRVLPKKMCNYFRDPFMCIDIMPTENENAREARFLSSIG